MKSQCVVTLVHGTWARKTQWIRPRSALSKALRSIDAADVRLFRFVWSGRNSAAARRRAAARLAQKLALRMQQYPHARHYIVCHSHGGAVALRAVAADDILEKIDGVVCLATPFLIARQRDLGRDPIEYLSGAVLALSSSQQQGRVASLPGWGVGGATVGPLLAVSALLWPMMVLLSLFLLPAYGWEIAAGNILLDVTAEATPLSLGSQPWLVHLIDSARSSELDERRSLLIHSQVYDDPAVITLVCGWIADRSAKATPAVQIL